LAHYPGTFVVISHDKVLLNDVTNYTIVLEDGAIVKVKGNYQAYEEQKEIRFRTLEKKQKVLGKRKQQLERFVQRFHAQPNRASAVRNKRKMIERMETVELPPEKHSIKEFEFPPARNSGYTVLTLEGVDKFYGDKQVYKNLNFEITRGQKICLVGPNGAGKSTLLKMLGGVVEPDGGSRKLGHQVDLGYFSQARLDVLNPEKSAFDEVAAAASGVIPALQVRTLLGLFNFHGDDVFKPVKVLSGGEKSRLILAKLLISPPNFILLDEPTTHLDIDGVEALTKAFKQYEGTLCFISHDLFFVKEIANHVVEIEAGQLKNFPGGLDYYLSKKSQTEGRSPLNPSEGRKAGSPKSSEQMKKQDAHETTTLKEMRERHKVALRRLTTIKEEIKRLEAEKKELEVENYVKARILSEPFSRRDAQTLKEYGQRLKFIQQRIRDVQNTIDRLTEERNTMSKQL
jgi:ATP-binding cassette subfamily F protein 3